MSGGKLSFTLAEYKVREDGTWVTARIGVMRSDGALGAVSGRVNNSSSTAPARATRKLDYEVPHGTGTNQTLSWADGELGTKFCDFVIVNDNFVEGDEILPLTLNTLTGGATAGAIVAARLIILDDDFVIAKHRWDKTALQFENPDGSWGDTVELKGEKGEIGETGLPGATGERGLTGVRGDRGETGAAGVDGIQGIQGITGEQGEQGLPGCGIPGSDGIQGLQGITGERGETGAAGSDGIQGLTGERGLTGAQGIPGERGAIGATGLKGDRGETGATGQIGQTGSKGDKGDRGETGSPGLQGSQGIPGATGQPGQPGQPGAKGDRGEVGVNWRGTWAATTAYVPRDCVAHNGSSYIATAANINSVPATSSSWNLLAAQGIQGLQGDRGLQGSQGAKGDQGETGQAGQGAGILSKIFMGIMPATPGYSASFNHNIPLDKIQGFTCMVGTDQGNGAILLALPGGFPFPGYSYNCSIFQTVCNVRAGSTDSQLILNRPFKVIIHHV
ncbi:MAG: hypothetical protein ABI262_08820 [Microcoleus sp.]